jgi:hypothetical protein
MSLTQEIFPDRTKYSIIRPIYKNGDKSQISNCRGLSLLMGFSKIMEIVKSQRLKQHLGMCNILPSEQYGFRDAVCLFVCLLYIQSIHTWSSTTGYRICHYRLH